MARIRSIALEFHISRANQRIRPMTLTGIENALTGHSAVELLWAWDGLIKDSCAQVSQGLTQLAQTAVAGTTRELKDGLAATMQHLAKAQAEGDLSAATAPRQS